MYLFFFISIVIAFVLFIVFYFNSKQIIKRTLRKIPNTRSIISIRKNELTKITGKALHVQEPLIAPFSKRKCVFYNIVIEEKRRSNNSSRWVTILDRDEIQPFFIEKNGDQLIVNPTKKPKNYKRYLIKDSTVSSGTFNDPTPEFEALLKRYNIKGTNFFGFNKSLRYSEGIIEVGEEITVAGIANWKELNESIEGYSYSKIATLESRDKQKLIITDLSSHLVNKI